MKKLTEKEREVYNSYHLPGCSAIHKRKINAIFLSPANSLEHELWKCRICYDLLKEGRKFVTEAVRNKKDESGKERRIDILALNGDEIEIETNPRRASRFVGTKSIVVRTWNKKIGELLK